MNRTILQGLALVAAAAIGYGATTRVDWYQPSAWAVEPLPYAQALMDAMPEGCRFLSEGNLLNYNIQRSVPFILFSKYSRPLFEAEDAQSIESFLKKENICSLITLRSSYLERMHHDTPLMNFMSDDRYTIDADDRYYDPSRYYRWEVFRYPFRGTPRLVVLGPRNARLVWHPEVASGWAGKVVTVSYFMRSRTPRIYAAIVSDGAVVSAGENDPGNGEWNWGYVSHTVAAGTSGFEIGFGPTFDTGHPGMVELANVVITVDGTRVADSTGFDAWQPGQPLPAGWSLNRPGSSLYVSTFD